MLILLNMLNMCYSPVKILNPSRRYDDNAPMYLFVPCGHCADCMRQMHNDWFFRAKCEYDAYKRIGGAVYFVTLTYNDANLPKLHLPDGSVIPCFYKRHIHNFIKYFRILLQREGLEYRNIKYLIGSEYSDKNTKRPHYHLLLFVPYHIPCDGQNSLFTRLITTAWHYGFCVCSKFGWEILSNAGIRYATKYVCKEFGFYKGALAKYLFDCDRDTQKFRRSLLSDYLPRHWQSVGFGSPFIATILKEDNPSKYLFINQHCLNLGKNDVYRIPRYYHLKLEKKTLPNISKLLDKVFQKPTIIGLDVMRMRFEERVENDMRNLRRLTSDYLNCMYPSYERAIEAYSFVDAHSLRYSARFSAFTPFVNRDNYTKRRCSHIKFISEVLPKLDLRHLSEYRCWLRHLPIYTYSDPSDLFGSLPELIESIIHPTCLPPEFEEIGLGSVYASPLCEREHLRDVRTCKDLKEFRLFENICRVIDYISDLQSMVKECNYITKQEKKKKVRDAFPNVPTWYTSVT